jgi:putative transposase
MPKGYLSSQTSIYFLNYHFVWCPKYRRKVLVESIKQRLEEPIRLKCHELKCEVLALSIQPDYVHLFVKASPKLAPNRVIGEIKGYTSRVLRQEYPELRSKLPTLWTRSYFVSTHGHISDGVIQRYIEVMLRAYRFRLYPNRMQDAALSHHLWLSKELWNRMLDYSKRKYKRKGKFASKKELRELVKHQGLYSQAAQELVDRLVDATWRFVRMKKTGEDCGFPRFRSFGCMKSLCYPQKGFRLIGNRLKVTPFGEVKLKLHRPIKGKIKTLVLKRKSSGKWFAIFTAEEDEQSRQANNGIRVGVNLGLSKLAVVSDGSVIANPRHIKKHEDKIAVLSRRLSKKKMGSQNRAKAKVKLAETYEKLANLRLDFLHKTSRSLVNRYSVIALENLNVKSMVQEKFGKQINDAGWGMLASMLCYKAASAGCRVIFVNPEGTTQQCSRCGTIVPKRLADRVHMCPNCGLTIDRDLNAACNILKRSTAGHAGFEACEVAPRRVTVKQEAHTYS